MDSDAFLPDPGREKREAKLIPLTKKEKALFDTYAKEKGWPFAKTLRVCTRAIILMEYNRAATIEEALKKSVLLDVDGRSK